MEVNREILPGQEEYWAGYQASIEKAKNDPRIIEFDKLCFEVFGKTEAGKKLLEELRDRYIMASTPGRDMNTYDKSCIYFEGFRDCIRLLMQSTRSYQERREAEDQKAIKQASEAVL